FREMGGVALDRGLDLARQCLPRRAMCQQGEAGPPMAGQAQMCLDLVEPQRLDDTERVALAVEGLGLQSLIHAAERHHAGLGAEPAFREYLEAERTFGVAADRLGHLGEAARGRAVRRLVEAEAVVEVRVWHSLMIIGCAGSGKLLILPLLQGEARGRGGGMVR